MSNLDDLLQDAASLSLSASSAPSVSFASPIAATGAALARMEGVSVVSEGQEGMGDSKRCYPIVLVDGGDRSICFGSVGLGSASFCVRSDCKIKSHMINKVKGFEGPAFYITRLIGGTVFSQPSVRKDQVPRDVQSEWEGQMWPLGKWVRAFQAIAIADDGLASNEDIKVEVNLLAEAELFRTPSKKRKGEASLDQNRTLRSVRVISHVMALPEDGSSELESVISGGSLGKGGLTRIVSRLEASTTGIAQSLAEAVEITHAKLIENDQNIVLVSGAVQNLMSSLGQAVEMDPKFEAPTMWGTTSFIGNEVVRLGDVVEDSKRSMTRLTETVGEVIARVAKSETTKTEADPKVLQILSMVMNRVQVIRPELDTIRAHLVRLDTEVEKATKLKGQRNNQASVSEGDDTIMDDLMSMLSSDVRGSTVLPEKHSYSAGTVMEERKDQGGDVNVTRIERELAGIADVTRLLVADVGLLKASAEDKSIKFGGLGLRSLQECHVWIKENFQGLRYGLVMDPLLMLDRIFGSDDVEAESQFKILESRVKLKITTGAEAAAIKALHFNRPRLFHKGRVAMTSERNTSKLSKLPNPKSWKSGGEGVRNYVTKQMNLIYSTVSHDISYAFGSDPNLSQAQTVATLSLNATVTFLTQLMGFIDTIYEKLHTHSKFAVDQAWSLTTQILDRVCEDLYAPKEGVAAAMTVEDPASICSHLLWSCFRTHDVMTTYIDHNFENHPAISAEYVKFLATNSGYDKVEKMEIVVATMKESVAKALESSDKATKRADLLTDKFSAANKEVEALKKKVQMLENKSNK